MKAIVVWSAIGGLAAAMVSVFVFGAQRVANLQLELEQRRAQQRELAVLAVENRRLAARQMSAEEAARLTESEEERGRWQAEAARLEAALQAPAKTAAATKLRWSGPETLAASDWKNAGHATPRATVETALWAAVGGEVEALAKTIAFDEPGRVAAERLLAGLPAAQQSEYGTPERLVALLAAKDLLSSATEARLTEEVDDEAGNARVRVRMRDGKGVTQMANLALRRERDGWRLIVSQRAVAKFAATLSSGAAPVAQ